MMYQGDIWHVNLSSNWNTSLYGGRKKRGLLVSDPHNTAGFAVPYLLTPRTTNFHPDAPSIQSPEDEAGCDQFGYFLCSQLLRIPPGLFLDYIGTVSSEPSWEVALLNLGNSLRGARQWDSALSTLQNASKIATIRGEAFFNLGILYFTSDDFGSPDHTTRLDKANYYFREYENIKGQSGANVELARKYEKEISTAIEREKRRKQREVEFKKRNMKRDDDDFENDTDWY